MTTTSTPDDPHRSCYIAGPMRGHFEFNFTAFCVAEIFLAEEGMDDYGYVRQGMNPAMEDMKGGFNPVGLTGNESLDGLNFDLTAAHRRDLHYLAGRATSIYLLEGWRDSTGATLEVKVAEACGLVIREQTEREAFDASLASSEFDLASLFESLQTKEDVSA